MSTVDKMLIKGIRSFDPDNKHVITFFKPLTLIVGHNGAGKTTIIECLKLSCTGEMPPNARSGHSFIHDPKVGGETETKGQIKLRFKTAAGKDVVCIRSFQLTQKVSKMEFKAIESVLQTINPHTGEKVCLSYRCADMDKEIPALMGVSKAILENVIFVHQDEANWPLQDPSTLKKKFDDIFSATRYTKALEVIKKLHKDQAQEIKTYKLKLENLQTLKDAAYKLRESIAKDEERTELVKRQMQELEGSIHDLDAKILNASETLKHLQNLNDQLSTKKAVRSTRRDEKRRQKADLPEKNIDTDEELKEWKTKFDDRIRDLGTQIFKLEREQDDTKTKSNFLGQTIKDSIWDVSKLQNEANAYLDLKKQRDSTIQNLFARHNLGSLPDPPFNNEVAINLTDRIKSRLRDLEKDLQDKKKLNEAEVKKAWDRYMESNDRWKLKEAQHQAKAEIKNDLLKRIEKKKNERDSFESSVSNCDLSRIDEKEKNMLHLSVSQPSQVSLSLPLKPSQPSPSLPLSVASSRARPLSVAASLVSRSLSILSISVASSRARPLSAVSVASSRARPLSVAAFLVSRSLSILSILFDLSQTSLSLTSDKLDLSRLLSHRFLSSITLPLTALRLSIVEDLKADFKTEAERKKIEDGSPKD